MIITIEEHQRIIHLIIRIDDYRRPSPIQPAPNVNQYQKMKQPPMPMVLIYYYYRKK